MTLPRYIASRFLRAVSQVLVVISLLILLVEVLEAMRRLAGRDGGWDVILQLSLLRLPAVIEDVLPIVILIGSLTLFIGLARSSEMVVMRANGVSAIRVVAIPVLMSLLIGVASVAVLNPVAAVTTRAYETLNRAVNDRPARASVTEEGVWFRQVTERGHTVIHATRALQEGPTLLDATMHVFDTQSRLVRRLEASQAILGASEWRLIDVREWAAAREATDAPSAETRREQTTIPTNLTAEQILDSFAPPDEISFWELPRFISQLEQSGFTATRHKQYLQTLLAGPVMVVAMVLIGAALTMRHARMAKTGIAVVVTVLVGFTLYFLRDLSSSFGAAGEIPVFIAAWAPPISALMAALGLILHLEDG